GFPSPRGARDLGIGMVHQHFTSIPALTVGENISLTAGWPETGRAAERRAASVVARLGLPLRPSEYVESLSAQMRQRLEIVKALAADASILLLDEPTAVLAPPEIGELLDFLRSFAAAGGTVVLITHKLDEVFRAADRVTVLRRGVATLNDTIARQTPRSLAEAMMGSDSPRPTRREARPGASRIVANQVTLRSSAGGPPKITDASFAIHAGQVTGVAAIDGNGQRELLRAVAGVDDIEIVAGRLDVDQPVAFIPEDRSSEGLIPAFTLAENLLLSTLDQSSWWLDWDALRRRTDELLVTHDIRADGSDAAAGTLSGGNQQKLIFAVAMARQPGVVVAEDPTRGLDIHAAGAIHEGLQDAAHNGAAVIAHLSDVDELLTLADRLLAIVRGRVRELPTDASRELVGDAMLALSDQ
ncbi:MAG: ATP-binding cassette domain-containing protein, partial [Gemmatimonadales bacterium]